MTIHSVTLLGSSSGRNAGDAALMSGIMDSIDASCGRRLRYEIPTIAPSFIKENYTNDVHPIPLFPWNLTIKFLGLPVYRSVMRTDLSVIFDAILFDRALYNPLSNCLSPLSLLLPHAKNAGKRLGFFNVGVGPITTERGKKMLVQLAEMMDFITVRDQDSLDILQSFGVKNPNILLTADAALNVSGGTDTRAHEILAELGFKRGREILAININRYRDTWVKQHGSLITKQAFLAIYAEAINRVCSRTGAAVLFISTHNHDIEITRELMQLTTSAPHVGLLSNCHYSHYEVKGVLAKVDMLFGMRLHSMILATSGHTPTLGLAHQPKCQHYFRSLDLQERMITFDKFSADNLVNHILTGWSERTQIRETLERRIPELKREALKAGEIVAGISRGLSATEAIGEINNNYELCCNNKA